MDWHFFSFKTVFPLFGIYHNHFNHFSLIDRHCIIFQWLLSRFFLWFSVLIIWFHCISVSLPFLKFALLLKFVGSGQILGVFSHYVFRYIFCTTLFLLLSENLRTQMLALPARAPCNCARLALSPIPLFREVSGLCLLQHPRCLLSTGSQRWPTTSVSAPGMLT